MHELKKMRKDKGLSPSFVAKRLDVSYRHFNRIENGEGYLTDNRMKILSKMYGVSKKTIEDAVRRGNIE